MKNTVALLSFTAIIFSSPGGACAQSDEGFLVAPKGLRYMPARFTDTNRIQLRYQWNLKSTLGAYETSGKRDPKWDAAVAECFEAYSRVRSMPSRIPVELLARRRAAARRALQAGCTDPLVQYVDFLSNEDSERSPDDSAAQLRRAQELATALHASFYPPLRKFWAHRRAGEYSAPFSTNRMALPPGVDHHLQAALTNLVRGLRDASVPSEEVYSAADALFDQLERARTFALHARVWRAIEPLLLQNWDDEYLIHLLRGQYYTGYAWRGRGNAPADRVPEENMKLYRERTALAEESLRRAWQLHTLDERVPLEMLTVCNDLGAPRAEMEIWFDRAMTLKPDYLVACQRKARYLDPRWHGTPDEYLAFGRQCVTNGQWTGGIPLLLVTLHSNLYGYTPRDQKTNYWKNPAVWRDLQLAYDHWLRDHPNDDEHRAGYIRHAALCGQWGTVRAQLPALTVTNYSVFGGRAEFQRLLREAAEKKVPD